MSETIVIPVQVEAEEFWSCVLGSAWETWDWWQSIKYSEGSDWDKVGEITVSIDDPENEDEVITKTLGVQNLANAYATLLSEVSDINWQDLDAVSGDNILQIAVLGEVIYG